MKLVKYGLVIATLVVVLAAVLNACEPQPAPVQAGKPQIITVTEVEIRYIYMPVPASGLGLCSPVQVSEPETLPLVAVSKAVFAPPVVVEPETSDPISEVESEPEAEEGDPVPGVSESDPEVETDEEVCPGGQPGNLKCNGSAGESPNGDVEKFVEAEAVNGNGQHGASKTDHESQGKGKGLNK